MKVLKRIRRFSIWQILLGFVLAITAHSQYQIKSWTTDDGLPQNTVNSIAQTPDGYLWLSTLDGLVRLDGVKFTVFNKSNTPGIAGNRFTQVIVDRDGDLWAATENSGVTRYNGDTFQTYSVPGDSHNEPRSGI